LALQCLCDGAAGGVIEFLDDDGGGERCAGFGAREAVMVKPELRRAWTTAGLRLPLSYHTEQSIVSSIAFRDFLFFDWGFGEERSRGITPITATFCLLVSRTDITNILVIKAKRVDRGPYIKANILATSTLELAYHIAALVYGV
jgi:hypothetical protein